jgi:hypothetical protein
LVISFFMFYGWSCYSFFYWGRLSISIHSCS